jgi:hypothetical protein
VPLQEWIHHWEEGAGARGLKVAAAILGFAALACLYDVLAFQGFPCEEAMETAQLARNLSAGQGYVTKSIRPFSIHLLQQAAAPGQEQREVSLPVPDLNNPPVYPVLLAAAMKVLPVEFTARKDQYWFYQPERWIAVFNQLFFLGAALLLFRIALRLFDARVAWLSTAVFVGTNLFWRFSVSGLSTMLLVLIFLGVLMCLIIIEERERAESARRAGTGLALLTGALLGIGGMTRYGFAWMIVPAALFVIWTAPRSRGRLCLALIAAFVVVMSPWLARNFTVSKTIFGQSDYAVLQETPPLPGNFLERAFDPGKELKRVAPLDVFDKFLANSRGMWKDDLPRFSGNWISAFFLVGLLIPFRRPSLGRVRFFLLFSLLVLFVVQAVGQTHLTTDSPEINSENLLILVAPLIFVYGVALFFILFDQLSLGAVDIRGAVIGCFILVLSVPFIASLVLGHTVAPNSPYSPLHIQTTARMLKPEELMMSDIPGAVAWYGDRDCAWLTADDDREFNAFNKLEPVQALFLTQRTTDDRFLSEMMLKPASWSHFVAECQAHGEVPTGFPLTKAPTGFLPYQMFLSDKVRWRTAQ